MLTQVRHPSQRQGKCDALRSNDGLHRKLCDALRWRDVGGCVRSMWRRRDEAELVSEAYLAREHRKHVRADGGGGWDKGRGPAPRLLRYQRMQLYRELVRTALPNRSDLFFSHMYGRAG